MALAPRHFTLGARDPACELRRRHSPPTAPPTAAAWRSSTSRRASAVPPPRPTWPHITRMVDYLPGLSFWWPTVSAADCAETAQLHELEVGLNNTVKHLQGMVMGARQARYAVEMATVIAGSAAELRRRPVLSDLIGTISPLAARQRRHRGRPGLRRGRRAGVLRDHADAGHDGAGHVRPAPTRHASAELVSATVLLQLAYPGAPVLHSTMLSHGRPAQRGHGELPAGRPHARLATELAHAWGVPAEAAVCGTDSPCRAPGRPAWRRRADSAAGGAGGRRPHAQHRARERLHALLPRAP